MSTVKISAETFQSIKALQKALLELGEVTTNSVYAVLGRTSWHGRENILDIEEKRFEFGRDKIIYTKKGKRTPTTFYTKQYGWVTPNRVSKDGRPFRMVNYSFESAKALKSKTAFARSVKSAYVTSRMMNLFENTARWMKNSPKIQYENQQPFKYHKGDVRQGYNIYAKEYRAVENAIPVAIGNTERDLQRKINEISR